MNPAQALAAFYEIADQRPFDAAALASCFAPTFVDHNRPDAPADLPDSSVAVGLFIQLASAFPDGRHQLTLLENLSENRAMVYWNFTGTHTASFFGNEPSNRQISIHGVDVFTVANGKFTEQWHVEELLQLQAQMMPKQ
jgi:SnoaL-like polyketide cyclase